MRSANSEIKIFSCNAHHELAEEIAKELGLKLGNAEVGRFSDGEISVRIDDKVRGADVFIIQPTSAPVNENLMELLIMIDGLRRASAGRITAVIPYYGYARQDRKTRARDPISARLVADLIQTAGAHRVLVMDLHCAQIQGFFNIPVDHLVGMPLLTRYYTEKFGSLEDFVAVSPDLGSVGRARSFATKLDIPLAIIDKRRPKANVSEIMNIIGNIEGKRVILVDDMIDTAGTITNAANALKERGATEVYACCTHAVLSGPAIERIEASAISELVVLNTIKLSKEKRISKLKEISVAPIMADAIHRIHEDLSVSKLFD
ncbi:MAG: ribose-phosphate pyrophosphokinae [Epulopiscium sp.]|jgi:ribose-phosphate pyrophosphokinase|uniref:Ribose-phosphate pyrophosphokinase n=1 Tax=Defluviitalea raffinosedens TaxID=1450156 RepID=A0A7C8LLT5_9FIRM|nr:ribose-phosphate diphosphokinase [Defluviitalea raffinosedens]MBZ4668995.1 ribose-phosphate diphosphokinase [Defluviitaleaceae bacterium]MDK2787406.1 ribose-phosphate pyrophosphokinae [Candidatus Epulonipiscium sp.]KAE9636199.1 ribose-phosphate diphosphokinase [Defluviitalea raffinosedens]MBM7684944.1 ribose-phosphate pyrophosphokinase [Defluviitalea raffinosedens]HHW66176.1 ribose-phosphate diphosphokinase [Candidatus Epulonipiscium sp.]